MSTFDIRPDAPGLLRVESVNISMKFDRTGPTTGRISWNIPSPAPGCSADTQAYNGMVVVIDTIPANAATIPTKGQVYTSDATADVNLFAGDKLGSALVIGAFYGDRTTTFFDVTGLMPNTPYYVSGFPVDAQYRYFIEGVHAYSLDYTNRGTAGSSGTQVVVLNANGTTMGLDPQTYTGLSAGIGYNFSIQLGIDPVPQRPVASTEFHPAAPSYTITIAGEYAQTYTALAAEINKQFALLSTTNQGPTSPNTNSYFYSTSQKQLFQWNGTENVPIPVIVQPTQPNNVTAGTYWLNPTTNALSEWSGTAWTSVVVYPLSVDPTVFLADKTVWYNNGTAYEWNGSTWCQLTTFVQATDPSLAVQPAGDAYWFNTAKQILYKWNGVSQIWVTVIAVKSATDPNAPATGSFWFNSSTNTLYQYGTPSAGWNLQSNVSISETAPLTPAAGKLWYNPVTQVLMQRDNTNTTWVAQVVVTFYEDPTLRSSCDLWWNTTTQKINVWDKINSVWVVSNTLYQQSTDPSNPPVISNGTVWFDTTNNTIQQYENSCFSVIEAIRSTTDPRTGYANGSVWHNTTTNTWYVRSSNAWVLISPVISAADPNALTNGTFWFNTSNSGLSVWNGASWATVTYTSTSPAPNKGTLWFDTTVNTLKQWTGAAWIPFTPIATVQIDTNQNLLFTDTSIGSTSQVRITDGTLFQSLETQIAIDVSNVGQDGASDTPSYSELGLGTDGNDAPRDSLINELRFELGYPSVDVELTKEQMDYAINKALSEFRARSSIAYKRGFFFTSIKPNEQRFMLTNKVHGHNKIVDVVGVYRLTSSFLASAHGAGVYGQIVLQHMYNMGSFDMLSYHIMSEYTKLLEILFAGRVTFTWNEQKRELFIHNRFSQQEQMVAIEATEERTEQDLITDRYTRPWIRRYAGAVCRLMLAETRGKFSTLPGASGSVTLNAGELRQAARDEMDACINEILDYVADRPEEYGMGTQFLFG